MADGAVFETACASLEQSGALDRLAARGTIRIALKQAGLEPKSVTVRQLSVVLGRVLPAELAARGVPSPEALCARIAAAIRTLEAVEAKAETPEDVFARLGS